MRASILGAFVAASFAVTACGGSQKEAEEPSSEAAESAPSHKTEIVNSGSGGDEKADDDSEKKSDKKASKDDKKSDDKAEKEDAPKDSHTAKDVITKPDSLWVYSFSQSEPHQEAEKKCKAASKDDPKKTADCMAKAQKGQTERDAMAFQADGDKVFMSLISRKGGAVTVLHKMECDVEDSEKKITLKTKGKDLGKGGPGGLPREIVIDVDGDSSIAITDPRLGRLVYEAKLGILGKQDR